MTLLVEPLILSGSRVRLEPLSLEHVESLKAAVVDGELWKLWYTSVASPKGMQEEVARRLSLQTQGSMLPFIVRDAASGDVVGMTSYMNIDAKNRRLEIGSTWYAARVQRTGLNTECKQLLLTHAFETLRCIAVEFRTHWMNRPSRAAIERLGAKQDGILRNHQLMKNGSHRDTVVFSIIESEWPVVKINLAFQLSR